MLVVDDHPFIVNYSALLLEQALPGLRVLKATNGAEALALTRTCEPDLVMLDITLTDGNGLDLIAPMRAGLKPPAIVIFTGYRDEATLRRVEALGVAGLLWKADIEGRLITQAISLVLAGGTYVSPGFMALVDRSRFVPVRAEDYMPPDRKRILVVKWDRLVAESTVNIASEVFPTAEIRQCHSLREARGMLREQPADLGLFGLTLPDGDGLDFISEVHRERLVARIVVLSGRRDERTRHWLHRAPIAGYFDCGSGSGGDLREAIRVVDGGGRWFSAGSLDLLAGGRAKPARLHALLTPVELQVFAVLGDGSDDPNAAERLGVSENTLHAHRSRIMSKLGLHTRTELMNEARRRGVVRFTPEGLAIYPGFEQEFAERAERLRAKRQESGGCSVAAALYQRLWISGLFAWFDPSVFYAG